MNESTLEKTLGELGIPEFVIHSDQSSLLREVSFEDSEATTQDSPENLPRIAYTYEVLGISAYQDWISKREDQLELEYRAHFEKAFACWKSISWLGQGDSQSDRSDPSAIGLALVAEQNAGDPIIPEISLAYRLAVCGMLAQRATETRLELLRFDFNGQTSDLPWRDRVTNEVLLAYVLLVRKGGGWADILEALRRIDYLRDDQLNLEAAFIEDVGQSHLQLNAATQLVALYHLAQIVSSTAQFLKNGESSTTSMNALIDRHRENAVKAFNVSGWTQMEHLSALFWAGARQMVTNSIWSQVSGLGDSAKRLADALSHEGRPNPVLELWPSQQEALRRNILNPYWRSIVIEMPTSAGKTLLAKFVIIQTLSLQASGTIVYIVPTRALVNQVTLDLRTDLRHLDPSLSVEMAVPVYDLDPTEDRLLQTKPNILVTTPEKLDLLIRRDHAASSEISLVIVDEAHNLAEQIRGARLELLLSLIKRERPGARFLLLSPFIPNSQELAIWLGEDRAMLPTIQLSWKPSRRVVGLVDATGRQKKRRLILETVPAADNTDVEPWTKIVLGEAQDTSRKTIDRLSRATVRSTVQHGSVLVLCRGPLTAVTRALKIANEREEIRPDPFLISVIRYIEAEAGTEYNLSYCLRRGVAYHHSGLSQEARWLIEDLIRRDILDIICGTTTLAQGVNFPIRTVIVETLTKGNTDLTYQDFWNIAGRAGRTMMDPIGLVAFPVEKPEKREAFLDFLEGEAVEISSRLAQLIVDADKIAEDFNMQAIHNWPELSSLLRYLSHAMRVSGVKLASQEVEDILRSSLVYLQANREDPRNSERLVELCVRYIQSIEPDSRALALSDVTGFATPSVLYLLAKSKRDPELKNPDNWHPERLFSRDIEPLSSRIQAVAELPEIELGQGAVPPFNPELVAKIIRDWVQGAPLSELAEKYWKKDEDPERKLSNFSKYLHSQLLMRASWGIGALQDVSLERKEDRESGPSAYVPSMIYFGVNTPEAVWLRMAGVPRVVAGGLADNWKSEGLGEPRNFDEIRSWVASLSDKAWQNSIPPQTDLTPDDMRVIWLSISG